MNIYTTPQYQNLNGQAKTFFDYLDKSFDWNTFINDPEEDATIKKGVRMTIIRLLSLGSYQKMLSYYWSAVVGTPNSIAFSDRLKAKGYMRFEDILEDIRKKFR